MNKITPAHALGMVLLAATACSQGEARPERAETSEQALLGPLETTTSGAVALLRGNNPDLVLLEDTCSAALIAPNLALTARHCVEQLTSRTECSATFTGSPTHGYFAIRTEADVSVNGTPFVVSQIRKPITNAACDGDIALLILETSIPAATLAPIVPRLASPPMVGGTYSAIGYGASSADPNSTDGRRRRAEGSRVACAGDCAGAPSLWYGAPSVVCPGDSGGPALDAQGEVIGVVSRGSCGAAGGIDLYTRPDAHAALIVAAALEAATLGGYPAPAWAVLPPSLDAGADDAAAEAGAAAPHRDAAAPAASEGPSAPASAAGREITKSGCSITSANEPGAAWPFVLLLVSLLVALRERRRARHRRGLACVSLAVLVGCGSSPRVTSEPAPEPGPAPGPASDAPREAGAPATTTSSSTFCTSAKHAIFCADFDGVDLTGGLSFDATRTPNSAGERAMMDTTADLPASPPRSLHTRIPRDGGQSSATTAVTIDAAPHVTLSFALRPIVVSDDDTSFASVFWTTPGPPRKVTLRHDKSGYAFFVAGWTESEQRTPITVPIASDAWSTVRLELDLTSGMARGFVGGITATPEFMALQRAEVNDYALVLDLGIYVPYPPQAPIEVAFDDVLLVTP